MRASILVAVGVVIVAICAFLYFQRRGSAAEDVRRCMEKEGATVRKAEEFMDMFPYLESAGKGKRVEGLSEFKGAAVYGVRAGDWEGLLFIGKNGGDARSFERAVRVFDLGGQSRSRSADNVMLLWIRAPLTGPDPVGDCVR